MIGLCETNETESKIRKMKFIRQATTTTAQFFPLHPVTRIAVETLKIHNLCCFSFCYYAMDGKTRVSEKDT